MDSWELDRGTIEDNAIWEIFRFPRVQEQSLLGIIAGINVQDVSATCHSKFEQQWKIPTKIDSWIDDPVWILMSCAYSMRNASQILFIESVVWEWNITLCSRRVACPGNPSAIVKDKIHMNFEYSLSHSLNNRQIPSDIGEKLAGTGKNKVSRRIK